MHVTPTTVKERISSLDILRGFGLLGIILVNVLAFNASFFDFGGFYNSLPDEFQQNFYNLYISLTADKFIFIFSFLFGYGIYIQYQRFTEKGESFTSFLSRRMLVLSLFGILHILFLWAGDILLLYALAGFVVLILRKLPRAWLLIIAAFFYFFIGIWLTAAVWVNLPNALSSTCTECLEQAKVIYADGNYSSCLILRLEEFLAFRNISAFYYLPKIIGTVLFGFVASSHILHQKVATKKRTWSIVLLIIAAISVILYVGFEQIVDFDGPFANAVYMTGYELMSLFIGSSYLLLIMLFASYKAIARILKPIALMGRMSLTNYIMQSVILATIFYGWGFGLFGQTTVTSVTLIGISVYLLQTVMTIVWFKFFNLGPLEKLWRVLSYKNIR